MRLAYIGSIAALFLAVGAVRADETVENPEFTGWSKFKKGTSVTLKSIVTISGKSSEQLLTYTLDEVAVDKVAVVVTLVIATQGQVLKPNALRQEIPKTLTLAKDQKKEDVLAGKPAGTFEEGKVALKVCGIETKTRWFKFKSTDSVGVVTEGQVWVCADVPGLIVKRHQTSGGALPVTTMTELNEFKKP
jgi:hypothetical protein